MKFNQPFDPMKKGMSVQRPPVPPELGVNVPRAFDPMKVYDLFRKHPLPSNGQPPLECFEFLATFLRRYSVQGFADPFQLQDDPPEVRWLATVQQAPAYANAYLDCLSAVLQAPPDNLIDMLHKYGDIYFYNGGGPLDGGTEDTNDDYINWLKQVAIEFQQIYDATA